jgi:RimJ/RimL family protein N-acetyltransferase
MTLSEYTGPIEAPRLSFRRLAQGDEGTLAQIAGTFDFDASMQNVGWPAWLRYRLTDARIVISRIIVAEGVPVGYVEVSPKKGPTGAYLSIGFWIAPSHWGHGYATEAVGSVLKHVPESLPPVYASVHPDNHASIKVLEKCGFAPCERAPDDTPDVRWWAFYQHRSERK